MLKREAKVSEETEEKDDSIYIMYRELLKRNEELNKKIGVLESENKQLKEAAHRYAASNATGGVLE